MLPHQERVIAEERDLFEKVSKLRAFFNGPIFQTLPFDEQARLDKQFRYMTGYLQMLEDRIAAF